LNTLAAGRQCCRLLLTSNRSPSTKVTRCDFGASLLLTPSHSSPPAAPPAPPRLSSSPPPQRVTCGADGDRNGLYDMSLVTAKKSSPPAAPPAPLCAAPVSTASTGPQHRQHCRRQQTCSITASRCVEFQQSVREGLMQAYASISCFNWRAALPALPPATNLQRVGGEDARMHQHYTGGFGRACMTHRCRLC
jgi:hypothetical protein